MKKKIAQLIIYMGFTIPFILQTDLYPFLRFGMFAEPVKHKIQCEQFFLDFYDQNGEKVNFKTEGIGLYKSKIDYLMRNYYYRKEPERFLKYLHPTLLNVPGVTRVEFSRCLEHDTTLVATLNIYE